MPWRKRKTNPSSRFESIPNRGIRTYSYHNVRNKQPDTTARNIKKLSTDHLNSARKLWFEKFGLIILMIAIVACLIDVLYLSSSSQVALNGSDTDSIYKSYSLAVQSKANKLLASSIFNTTKITVNTEKINSTLEADFPMFASITMSLPLVSSHPVLSLTPAEPTLVLNNASGRYLLNENGQIMLRSTLSSSFSSSKLPQVNYAGTGYIDTGQQILTSQEVVFIETVVYELSLRGNKIAYSSLPQGTSELDVYLTAEPYYVKFNLDNNNPREQAGSLLATQNYLKSQNITPGQYIDVRTDGRVYYQ